MISRNRIFIIMGLLIVAGLFMSGCTQQATPGAAPTTSQTQQETLTVQPSMANPASVNCKTIGGTTGIKKNADGSEYGMCTFSNGTSCEEWALYRGEGCVTNVTATNTSAEAGMANPASVNCKTIGGTTEIKKNADGGEYGMCTFSNGTSCEEWALYRGEGCTNGTVPAQ